MSITRNLVRQVLPGALGTLYTVPNAKRALVSCITGVNTNTAAASDWFVYLVPSGDAAGVANAIIPGTAQSNIPAGKNLDYDTFKVLNPGDTIEGFSNGTVTIHIDGAVIDI